MNAWGRAISRGLKATEHPSSQRTGLHHRLWDVKKPERPPWNLDRISGRRHVGMVESAEIENEKCVPAQADIYSLGCIFIYLLGTMYGRGGPKEGCLDALTSPKNRRGKYINEYLRTFTFVPMGSSIFRMETPNILTRMPQISAKHESTFPPPTWFLRLEETWPPGHSLQLIKDMLRYDRATIVVVRMLWRLAKGWLDWKVENESSMASVAMIQLLGAVGLQRYFEDSSFGSEVYLARLDNTERSTDPISILQAAS